jgi:putative ABC transport system substrate-binding protein
MNRRTFLRGLTLGTVTTPLSAEAQQAGQIYRVGFIFLTSPVSEMAGTEPVHYLARTFVQALRALGYVEGQNLILERRSAEGQNERLSGIVAELVRLKADVIVTGGDPLPRVAKAVTTTVPIIMTSSPDPVGDGLVQSLARPGGNITGLANTVGPEIGAKRLELLKAMLPRLSRVAYLCDKAEKDWESPRGKAVRTAAQALGVTLVRTEFTGHQYTDAFAGITRVRANALFVAGGAAAYADRALIVDFATRTRLPSTFGFREAVDLGALMSYGAHLADNYRRAATYVDKILRGAKPGDLPVEQPTKFELVINLKTAKALGLTIPQTLLLQADHVIE